MKFSICITITLSFPSFIYTLLYIQMKCLSLNKISIVYSWILLTAWNMIQRFRIQALYNDIYRHLGRNLYIGSSTYLKPTSRYPSQFQKSWRKYIMIILLFSKDWVLQCWPIVKNGSPLI